MAQSLAPNTQVFSDDQRLNFRALYWDTTTTALRTSPANEVTDTAAAFETFESYATVAEVEAVWPLTNTVGGTPQWYLDTAIKRDGTKSLRLTIYGTTPANSDVYRTRTFSGFTPGAQYRVLVPTWQNYEAGGSTGIAVGVEWVDTGAGRGSAYIEENGTLNRWFDLTVLATADADGNITLKIGGFHLEESNILNAYERDIRFDGIAITPYEPRYTAFGTGVEFGIFDLLTSEFAPTSRAAIESALAPNSGITTSVLGYEGGTYRTGIVPLVYQYWGAGSPPGGARSKQVVLKYTGVVQRNMPASTFVFAGQGKVYAYVRRIGGTTAPICTGTLREPDPLAQSVAGSAATVQAAAGYVFNVLPVAFEAGDEIDIYYVHNGEPWGGIACKVVNGALTVASDVCLTEIREAPMLGVSFMAKEAMPLPATDLPYVASAEIRANTGAVTEMALRVALTTADEANGYSILKTGDDISLVDNANAALTVKKGRAVHFEGGFQRPDGTAELYGRFAGYIEDIFPDAGGDMALITCRSFEGRLAEVFDENNPDRLSYHANGYVFHEAVGDPVYPIPAYDQWPLETTIIDLCYKAGVDPYSIGLDPALPLSATQHGRWRLRTAAEGTTVYGGRMFGARLLASPSEYVRLERNSEYGNVGVLTKDYLPKDEPYLFPPQVTQRVYDRIRALVDHYGYDFFFNGEGQCVLTGRNNPAGFQYLTQSGKYGTFTDADQRVTVDAVGGLVYERLHSAGAWSKVIEGDFSRLDLYAGVGEKDGLNGGKLAVQIEVRTAPDTWETVSTSEITTYYVGAEGFYYDGLVRADGSNAAVFRILSLPFDHYRVTLTPAGPNGSATDCLYRLNGVAVYERDPEQSYYTDTTTARKFTTTAGALKVEAESAFKDLRNHVIVVGARKASVTDSAKLNEEQNPNNPEREFHVAVGVDPFSIYDPTSANFVGMKRMTVIFEQKVTDSDFARWLTRTILFRYRMPKTNARFTHTVIPTLELRDAVHVVDERHKTVDHLLWVQGYTEKWTPTEAISDVVALATPEIPSYQPREDLEIDTYFVDPADGKGEPVINLQIGYKNIYGIVVSNLDLTDVDAITAFASRPRALTETRGVGQPMQADAIGNGTSFTLSKPAIPETIYLGWNFTAVNPPTNGVPTLSGFPTRKFRALVNNPYRHFFNIASWNSGKAPTLNFTFEEGDGTAGVYDKAYYQFPSGDGQWYALYDYFVNRTGKNPFYDPYTSTVGNLVSITFDQLVSGRIRVSLWDANDKRGYETPIAWLTNPTADPEEPEAHWQYSEAGSGREFLSDLTDNIGFWNTLQTTDTATELAGSFGDKPLAVGRGFYAANDRTTHRHTYIGDTNAANFDAANAPYYTIGQYGQFYVKVEVLNDKYVRKDMGTNSVNGKPEPRVVDSHTLPTTTVSGSTINDVPEVYIWSHLGEPDKVAIRIQDWAGAGTWTVGMPTDEGDWTPEYSDPVTADASFADGKPVRITFVPRPRRGAMFVRNGKSDPHLVSVKLTRQVHLKATIFDQFWLFAGRSWQGFHSKFSAGGTEAKRLQNRMYHNEAHTLEFADASWRTGEQLEFSEWIFDPTQFQKDFGTGQKERLRYGDYEQLEALPGFDPKRLGGPARGERSHLTLAFINYLMYFSAQTLDKSGRRQHCLNSWTDATGNKRGFIDRTKIASPTWRAASSDPSSPNYRPEFITDYEERGSDRYLARSIFVRQWKEPGWATGAYANSPTTKYSITDAHQLKFVQPLVTDFDPRTTALDGGAEDSWLLQYQTTGSGPNQNIRQKLTRSEVGSTGVSPSATTEPTLDTLPSTALRPSAFGTWTFDRPGVTGWFEPSPARDFHPYWVQFMPDAATAILSIYRPSRSFDALDVLSAASSNIHYALRDPLAVQQWYGYAYAANSGLSAPGGQSGSIGTNWWKGARLEKTVEELGAAGPVTGVTDSQMEGANGNRILYLYDYAKHDQLDRWDQYRGVISRAPYPDRKDASERSTYRDGDRKRSASAQPVKPSGTYFVNLGRYSVYTIAPVHKMVETLYQHFVDVVSSWYDIRFHHEFVWTSARYYPVTAQGGSVYMYVKDEYTNVAAHCGEPWWYTNSRETRALTTTDHTPLISDRDVFSASRLYFDSGAFMGFKPDRTATEWTADPFLQWQELWTVSRTMAETQVGVHGAGGFKPWAPFTPYPSATGQSQTSYPWLHSQGSLTTWRRMNMFDEYASRTNLPRLAVGPEVPEARPLVMNLSLPERLRG
jgi:hypothetical protein